MTHTTSSKKQEEEILQMNGPQGPEVQSGPREGQEQRLGFFPVLFISLSVPPA